MSDVSPESNTEQDWAPAFPGQRPPFGPGNDVAVRHGAYATVRLAPRAQEIADELRPAMPWYQPSDEPALGLLALTMARVEAATRALEEVDGLVGEQPLGAYTGKEQGASFRADLERLRADLRSWINTSRSLLADLGLTPAARAKLGLDVARAHAVAESALDRLRERGAETLAQRHDLDGDAEEVTDA